MYCIMGTHEYWELSDEEMDETIDAPKAKDIRDIEQLTKELRYDRSTKK